MAHMLMLQLHPIYIFVRLHVELLNPELLAHFHILTVILDIEYAWNMTTLDLIELMAIYMRWNSGVG